MEQALRDDPEGQKLSVRWVDTDEKSRLVTRDFNTHKTTEFFAATGNPLAQRIIPTIAVMKNSTQQ